MRDGLNLIDIAALIAAPVINWIGLSDVVERGFPPVENEPLVDVIRMIGRPTLFG
jgi:hypothetical protein